MKKTSRNSERVHRSCAGPAGSARLPDCDICEQVQVALGAVAFGPPDENGRCEKLHVCVKCWKKVKYALRSRSLDRLTKESQRLGFYDLPNDQGHQ